MISSLRLIYISKFFIPILLFSLFSCNKDDGENKSAKCKISSYQYTATGGSGNDAYTMISTHSRQYDEKGNQTGATYSYTYTYIDGTTASSTSTSSYQYDKDGFRVRSTGSYNAVERDNKTSYSSYDEVHEYKNGKMVKNIVTNNNNGTQSNYVFNYEYDNDGRVTKVSNTYNNSSTKYEYQEGKLFKITTTDAVGNLSNPFLELDSKGQLIKYIEYYSGYADENRYEYDQEGNVIREERWLNGKPSSASTREYDDKEYIYGNTDFKGSPSVPETRPYSTKHNIVRSTSYQGDMAGKWVISNSSTYNYTYNNHNFPIEQITKSLNDKGVEISSSKILFSYTGCD